MKRLLILASKRGYQTRSFAESARTLGAEILLASDRCHQLEDPWADGAIAVPFEQPEQAVRRIVEQARRKPVDGLIALGDRPTVAAAYAARELGIAYNSPESAENCRSKLRQREILRSAGLPLPDFFSFSLSEPEETILRRIRFPCVIKPTRLAASQGVIRVNDAREFRGAVRRIRELLESPEILVMHEPEMDRLLVESYIPGGEISVECLMTGGRLRILAVFDKPDPMEGPYFEETIYVTPSRLPRQVQARLEDAVAATVRAIGLEHGPVHAEFRVNENGPWALEAAPRPIGGLCARALRFGPQHIFLEELLVRHALGLDGAGMEREEAASGVMMIPVPRSGILEGLEGEQEARATPGIEDLQITARLHDFIAAWPEGASYLGFLFARGGSPAEVEAALRLAHSRLDFKIVPRLPVGHPATGKLPLVRATPRDRA